MSDDGQLTTAAEPLTRRASRVGLSAARGEANFLQALAGQPLTVFGDGKQTRSFCYVSDLVEGLLRLMASG